MEYSYDNGTIYDGTTPAATVAIEGAGYRTSSITISGQVQIKLEREGRGFKIVENGMPIGTTKGFDVEYLGTVYQVSLKELGRFINGRSDSFKIMSQGADVAEVTRRDNRIFISSNIILESAPLFIYLSFLSAYSNPAMTAYGRNRRVVKIPLAYNIAYYVLTFGALVFLLTSYFSTFPYTDSLVLFLAMVIAGYVARYYGLKKARKEEQSQQQ